jgi:small GTP-binding protein
VDYFTHRVELTKETEIRMEIWDTAGQEKYRSLISRYFKDSLGCVLVLDLTQPKTFEGIAQVWLDLLNKESPGNVCKVLLANKIDLVGEKESINDEKIKEFENKHNIKCFKTSAKTGEGIENAFLELAKEISAVHHMETKKQQENIGNLEIKKNGVVKKLCAKEETNISSGSCC